MKKIILLLVIVLTISTLHSQNINDALRYAQEDLNGTARFRAMSGAFGALGGDFSSLSVNPAGSVVFANNQVGLSLGNYNKLNSSKYFGNSTSENDTTFDVNQAGGVFVFNNLNEKTNWKKFAIAINYDNARNFDNSIFSAGTNPTNSIDKYFLYYANANANWSGIPLSVLQNSFFDELTFEDQQALLGYNTFVIDPVNAADPTNAVYFSNIPGGGNYYQENTFVSSGYNGKLTLNASAEYKEKFLFGLNINSYFTDYTQNTSFLERNSNPQNANPQRTVDRLRFNNELYTYGTGLSFQLGTIFKPVKEVRIGLAYESPTWYQLNDETTQTIATSGFGLQATPDTTVYGNSSYNPGVILIYETYRLQTPSKWTGSFAYVFGKKGLISFDYAVKDYSKTQFKPSREFTGTNLQMANFLDVANEIRLGAEYKIKKISLRGGYRFEESPYKDGKTVGDLTGYSGGLGYNFGSIKLDLAYSYWERESQQGFFTQGLTDPATINSKNNNVTVTMLFEL
jgi:hypothetical protein